MRGGKKDRLICIMNVVWMKRNDRKRGRMLRKEEKEDYASKKIEGIKEGISYRGRKECHKFIVKQSIIYWV